MVGRYLVELHQLVKQRVCIHTFANGNPTVQLSPVELTESELGNWPAVRLRPVWLGSGVKELLHCRFFRQQQCTAIQSLHRSCTATQVFQPRPQATCATCSECLQNFDAFCRCWNSKLFWSEREQLIIHIWNDDNHAQPIADSYLSFLIFQWSSCTLPSNDRL